jgi:hypothetical protein
MGDAEVQLAAEEEEEEAEEVDIAATEGAEGGSRHGCQWTTTPQRKRQPTSDKKHIDRRSGMQRRWNTRARRRRKRR